MLRKHFIILSILFVCTASLHAQITATPTEGCSRQIVQFQGIAGATNVFWDFKDGNTSNQLNPENQFILPGTYNVTFTGTVGGTPVNESIAITIHGRPIPIFTAPDTMGCVGLTVNFQDQSSSTGSTITNYSWTFGTGATSTSQNPSFTYNAAGQYDIGLKITDSFGCDSTILKTAMVKVSDRPKPVITPSSPSKCEPNLTVPFSAASSTSALPLTYTWDFGNGQTSPGVSPPAQTYTAPGTYIVTLVATDSYTCSDSVKTTVTIAKPVASFTVPNDTLCTNITVDASASTGYSFLQWNFGDGTPTVTTTQTTTSHVYSTGGEYKVKLTATSGSCTDTISLTIFVEDVKADFAIDSTYACSLPQQINFSDSSKSTFGLTDFTYSWTFSTGSVLYGVTPEDTTISEPTVTIFHLDTNRYTINEENFILTSTLTITSPRGCTDDTTRSAMDTIFLPTARLQPDTTQGCFPLQVIFSDSSRSKEPIISYEYIFGDGTPNFTTNDSATPVPHIYNTPGIYEAKLVITNSRGCIDTSYTVLIYVGSPPDPGFTLSPNNACINTEIQFTDASTATGGSPIDTWHYKTDGEFMMSSCYNDPNPEWAFVNGTGTQDVTLIACSRGCCDSITQANAITINGPFAEFFVSMDCTTPFDYTFEGNIKDADSWTWHFGDGNIDNTNSITVSHTYAATGNYIAMLIAINNTSGCDPDTFFMDIYVRDILADFTISDTDSIFCTNDPQTFDAAPSEGEHVFTKNGYVWLWGDGTPPTITNQSSVSHAFIPTGIDTVRLIVTDINGCRDTASMILRISSATAGFFTDSIYGCIPWEVTFNDTSRSDTTITDWFWNFGDGITETRTDFFPFEHIYTDDNPTSFIATLTITNAIGCSDSFSKTLTPSKPIANFFFTNNRCAGDEIEFNPVFDLHKEYLFRFGDGKDTTIISPYPLPYTGVAKHAYDSAGTGIYTVTLVVTDSIGCQDSTTQNINIQNYPKVGYTITTASGTFCYPGQVTFTDTSIVGSSNFTRKWELATGTPGTGSPLTLTYPNPGTYNTSLRVTTSFGCSSIALQTFDLIGPVADFTITPSSAVICKGQQITLQLVNDTVDISQWEWNFGDGSIDTNSLSPISHQYGYHPPNGQFKVTLNYYGENKSCPQSVEKFITVHQVIADFTRNVADSLPGDTSHCLGTKDIFTNKSTNGDSWQWDFGDGTTSSNSQAPEHEYTTPGTYTVMLSIIDNPGTGCVDTMRKSMVIYAAPAITAFGGGACKGDSVQLIASGGATYAWSPPEALNNAGVSTPMAGPGETTTYTVTASDANGCTGSDTAQVNIILPPPEITFDTTIIIGESVTMPYFISPVESYTFSWTPADSVDCATCPNPITRPFVNNDYILTVSDITGCFNAESYYHIEVLPLSSIDVPTSFTPNGDGINDIVYAKGWAIKRLIEFNIYNRWGELVFSTNDLNTGWDGTYKGVLQNVDTYAYTVKAETYVDIDPKTQNGHADTDDRFIKTIKGYVKLLR